jgi:hypothetical protein
MLINILNIVKRSQRCSVIGQKTIRGEEREGIKEVNTAKT